MMHPALNAAAVASRYRGVQLHTSTPVELVVMLYDGILRFVSEASDALEKGDRARAGTRIGRALAIVDELVATLDPKPAPALADNLAALYGFCKRRLLEANLGQSREALQDVSVAITPLRDAFAQLAKRR
jgi:flagellar protein FliS